ncbi:peptidylprolyl isomerase [Reinekea marinisedimentorum]|uniref:Peptidyl-prolyl cis-trans isomerase SurA n=1 Tax=Reinekea marinisedimentorum TaxID=230495 RepID=A0A4R3HVP0_9GAMM|nr:peptidylprolyl isomerase [Reinekea marinisedimentorum]TCS37182.1 peptidyl-prolyl cis-trans isomerase SurA [Reinekea marinisedimentorum]
MTKLSLLKAALVSSLLITGALAVAKPLDRIIVVVNDDIVTQQELDQRTAYIKDQYKAAARRMPADDVLQQQILDALILESLQMQLAEKGKITISDQKIDAAISNIAKRQKLTTAQFYQAMKANGLAEADVRKQITTELTLNELQQKLVARQVYVSDAEIDRFMATQSGQSFTETEYQLAYKRFELTEKEQANALLKKVNAGTPLLSEEDARDLGLRQLEEVPSIFRTLVPVLKDKEAVLIEKNGALHMAQLVDKTEAQSINVEEFAIRHILIQTDIVFDEQAAQSLLTELREKILAGESMADLADEYSQDEGTKGRGGLLDWSTLDAYVAEFSDEVKATPVGEVSEVFRSPYGFHILRVEDSRVRDVSVDVIRQQIRAQLGQARYTEALERWKTELLAESFVEYR